MTLLGSVLGPILLLFFINNLLSKTRHNGINLFADHTSMHGADNNVENLDVLSQSDIIELAKGGD